ncbi:hypothetical protein RvVAR0630_38960 [Agrobacterium vitis]|nr:hypothetical protein RvVAR0630_38960 [Agrobacterium vitis]
MSFANRPQADDHPAASLRHAGLVGMRNDAWIEEGRGFERILVHEIRADQLSLLLAEAFMLGESILHRIGAQFELP